MMNNDISESVSQGIYGTYAEENRRIQEISNELQRLCRLHEEESGNGKANGSGFEIEQRITKQYAKSTGMIVWDVVPRNVLVNNDGNMYVVDAEKMMK